MELTVVAVAVAIVVGTTRVVDVASVVVVSVGTAVVVAGNVEATVVVVVVTAVVVVVGKVAIQYRSYISRASDWYDLARIA